MDQMNKELIKKAFQLGYCSALEKAGRVYEFDLSVHGNGLSTRSFDQDFNNVGSHESGTIVDTGSKIVRGKNGNYYVFRTLPPTQFKDQAGRRIPHAFSVVTDNPRDAMRIARGKVNFDSATQSLMDAVAKSSGRANTLDRVGADLKSFKLVVGPGLESADKLGPFYRPDKLHKNLILKRLAKLYPGKAKAIAGAIALLGIGGGTLLSGHEIKKRKARKEEQA